MDHARGKGRHGAVRTDSRRVHTVEDELGGNGFERGQEALALVDRLRSGRDSGGNTLHALARHVAIQNSNDILVRGRPAGMRVGGVTVARASPRRRRERPWPCCYPYHCDTQRRMMVRLARHRIPKLPQPQCMSMQAQCGRGGASCGHLSGIGNRLILLRNSRLRTRFAAPTPARRQRNVAMLRWLRRAHRPVSQRIAIAAPAIESNERWRSSAPEIKQLRNSAAESLPGMRGRVKS